MKTVNTIMVAVDFSDFSINAAEYAARLAKDVGAKLLLVNIYNQRHVEMLQEVAMRVPEFSAKKYQDEYIAERKQTLDDLGKRMGSDTLEVETDIQVGVPYEALLDEIALKKPDLLVMGVKGRSNVMDMIIGSCAQKMFRHSPIPLLSIRGDESKDASNE